MIRLCLKMARKADEVANFVFVQLTEQEPGIYQKRNPGYARQDTISHETKESGHRLGSFETI
jgi:hypothetical protein